MQIGEERRGEEKRREKKTLRERWKWKWLSKSKGRERRKWQLKYFAHQYEVVMSYCPLPCPFEGPHMMTSLFYSRPPAKLFGFGGFGSKLEFFTFSLYSLKSR